MIVESAIVDRILSLSAVTALVGTKVRVLALRQGERIGVRVQRVSEFEPMHLRGTSGLISARIQVDSVAPEASQVDPFADAAEIDAAVKGDGAGSGLSGWKGTFGSPATLTVFGIMPMDARPEYDSAARGLVKIMRDYLVIYRN